MSDVQLRKVAAKVALPDLEGAPFTPLPGRLDQARVAIVTTAGLHPPDEPGYASRTDESFRALPADHNQLRLGHMSQNYDRSGFLADANVVFPLDRLRELVDNGTIGAVSDVHLAFLGSVQGNLATIRTDTGPHAARVLRDAGVDVVLLTPVCPMCTRTVCTLAHTLEGQGLSTVALSLVREHVERLRPPRALHVTFPFGRPLGRPDDLALQHRVLRAALGLLDSPSGPVLVDFPEVIDGPADVQAMTCTLPPPIDPDAPAAVEEARGLRDAYDRGLRRTSGRSGLRGETAPEDVPHFLAQAYQLLDASGTEDDEELAKVARRALDVRAYYEIAGVALAADQGGQSLEGLTAWFFQATEAGRLLRRLDATLRQVAPSNEPWRSLVPRAHRDGT